jgi:hypothetical protein
MVAAMSSGELQGRTVKRPPAYVWSTLRMEGVVISPYTLITLFVYDKKIIWIP